MHLIDGPSVMGCQREQSAYSGHMSGRRIRLVEINSRALSEAPSNQSRLVLVEGAVGVIRRLEDPFG